ncbi:MAG: TolC family protein [Muribaculaceae bacterium]|nr:TolC family protein [Muribaculaceae bacterium]
MRRITLFLIALTLSIMAQAQLTLEQCHKLAHDNWPLIKQYGIIEQSSSYTLSNIMHSWLPQVNISAQATYQNNVPSFPDQMQNMLAASGLEMNGLANDQYRMQADVSQKIFDGGKASSERALTQAQDAELKAQNDVDLYTLNKRVDELFFGILLMDERIKQTNLSIEMLNGNLDKLQSHVRNGIATTADENLLTAEILTVEQNRDNMQWVRMSYQQMLEIMIGQSIGDLYLVKPQEIEPATSIVNRPELKLIDAKIGTIQAREKATNASVMPVISLFGQAFYGYPGYNTFEAMLNRKWSLNAMVGVRAQWSLSSLYDRKNNLNKLNTARQQAELQRNIFLLNNSLEVVKENNEISRLRQLIKSDASIVDLRRNVRLAEESKLRNGVIDIHRLVERITDEDTAVQARIIHNIELLKTIYELKNTVNQ